MNPKLSLSMIFVLSILFFAGVSSRLAVVIMGDNDVVKLTEYEERTIIRKEREVLPKGLVDNPKQVSAN